MKMQIPRAPIPGANYTSDTRNYPWHRPADIENYDEAVANTLNRLDTPSGASLVYSLLDLDMSIALVTSAMLQQAISKGVMHIDMAPALEGGLMASPSEEEVEAAPEDEQQSMLGGMAEEETTDELA
jgi:hypothetical protein